MSFSVEQVEHLNEPLSRAHVRHRQSAGRNLSYIEGWHAIKEANRIFGHDGWSRETVSTTAVWAGKRRTKNGEMEAASYTAKVRVTVYSGERAIVREGTGAGAGFGKDAGEAHESAIKEAETDAMKRALMTFGNPFGLALYDKAQTDVADVPVMNEARPAAKPPFLPDSYTPISAINPPFIRIVSAIWGAADIPISRETNPWTEIAEMPLSAVQAALEALPITKAALAKSVDMEACGGEEVRAVEQLLTDIDAALVERLRRAAA